MFLSGGYSPKVTNTNGNSIAKSSENNVLYVNFRGAPSKAAQFALAAAA